MANRCRISQHGDCTACGNFVNPTRLHAHIHDPHGTEQDVVCNACYSAIAGSSTIVLQALQTLGIRPSGWDIVNMRNRGQIQILIQGWMDLMPPDAPARN